MRLIVIGGGIAGLAAARRARETAAAGGPSLDVTVLEASDRLGGKIRTERDDDGLPLELGPDSFLATKPRARELATELGLGDDLVGPGPQARRAYLLLKGRLRPLPDGLAMGIPTGLGPLIGCLRNGIIGIPASLRAGIEPFLPARRRDSEEEDDITIGEFTRGRLGSQVSSRLIAPLITGVFGASPDEISLAATMPHLAESRSLVIAMARRPRGQGSPFLSIRGGMNRLTEILAASLDGVEILLNTPATGIAFDGREYLVDAAGGRLRAAAVLVATPATIAAQLLKETAPDAATSLGQIRYHSSAIVMLRFAPNAIERTLDGSGYLAAPEDRAAVAAVSWLNTKWPETGWKDTWIRGVVVAPDKLSLPDDELIADVTSEIKRTMQATAEPVQVILHRWPEALPIYSPGHLVRVENAENSLPKGLGIAGAALRGIGVPDCISGGETAAERLISSLPHPL